MKTILYYVDKPKQNKTKQKQTKKQPTKELLELINKFSKVVGYKVNVQKSVVFLYTNNEAAEMEIKKIIPFAVAPKMIRYQGINPTKR